jgi:hypothetical protein
MATNLKLIGDLHFWPPRLSPDRYGRTLRVKARPFAGAFLGRRSRRERNRSSCCIMRHIFCTVVCNWIWGVLLIPVPCAGDGARTRLSNHRACRYSKSLPPPALPTISALAMERFAALQPHLENDVPLTSAARHGGISIRTAERWLARYRQDGLAGFSSSNARTV